MDNYNELIERGKRYVANKGDNPLIPVIAELTGAVEALQARVSELEDKVDGLDSDLNSAVNVAWHRGAHEWVRLNYPSTYEQLTKNSVPS